MWGGAQWPNMKHWWLQVGWGCCKEVPLAFYVCVCGRMCTFWIGTSTSIVQPLDPHSPDHSYRSWSSCFEDKLSLSIVSIWNNCPLFELLWHLLIMFPQCLMSCTLSIFNGGRIGHYTAEVCCLSEVHYPSSFHLNRGDLPKSYK